jgi:virulence factor Mce-like protein
MRRLLAALVVVGACTALALLAGGASGKSGGTYWVEFDNAFGLIEGGDVKIAGVRAGKIADLDLNRKTARARAEIEITQSGFGSLREDVHCESRPQSLIGEYFIDCLPGTSKKLLPGGATIPVSKTSSTVPPDLVNNILRKPYRERLSIILGELGAGVAGNEQNLNDAIRRAAPALRETDKVLAILADQNRVLADLTTNADRVVTDLARNKDDVGRFVDEARDTAVASAERRDDIAAGFHKLPGFLRQLTPTMKALGETAEAQAPTLRNLRISAKQLERFFGQLGPFANASTPAFKALGKAAVTGRKAVVALKPAVSQLRAFTKGTPELANNLDIVLRHLNDPSKSIEDDPRAAKATGRAMPTGYSGLEALVVYLYDQTMATNIFDQNSHLLKIGLIPPGINECSPYADVARAKEVGHECSASLGPNQPGINFPDPTATDTNARTKTRVDANGNDRGAPKGPAALPQTAPTGPSATPGEPAKPSKPPRVIDIPEILPGVDPPPINLPGLLDDLTKPTDRDDAAAKTGLLDYLLGGTG